MDPVQYLGPVQSVVEWKLLWLIPFLPLLGAAWNAFTGHWGQRRYGHAWVHGPAIGAMVLAFAVSAFSFVQLLSHGASERFLYNPLWRMIDDRLARRRPLVRDGPALRR